MVRWRRWLVCALAVLVSGAGAASAQGIKPDTPNPYHLDEGWANAACGPHTGRGRRYRHRRDGRSV